LKTEAERVPATPAAFRQRFLIEWAVVAVAATLLVAFVVRYDLANRADSLVYDALIDFDARPPDPDILIVAIDDRSLAALGRWPWPRTTHAALLDRLAAAKPRAVGYDVLFVESTPDDATLAAAMRAAAPVYVPLLLNAPGTDEAPYNVTEPVPLVADAAAAVGHVTLPFDPDGIVRRAALEQRDGDRGWMQLMQLLLGRRLAPPLQAELPLSAETVLVPYVGPPGRYPTVSAASVIAGEVPREIIADRFVLVGATASGLGDSYPTPVGGESQLMAGIEIQANLLDALRSGREIGEASRWTIFAASVAPLWLLLAGFLRLRPRQNVSLGLLLIAGTLAASAALLLQARVWLPPTAALVALVIVYPIWGWRRLEAASGYMSEELRRFSAEPDVLAPDRRRDVPSEAVARQIAVLGDAIDRARGLRKFVSDALYGLPDPTMVVQLDGRVALANAAARDLFGEDPVGRTIDDLLGRFAPAESAADVGLSDGRDIEVQSADNRSFDLRHALCRDPAGAPVAWITRLTDISDLKAAGRQRESLLRMLTHDMRSPQASILAVLDGEDAAGMPGPLRQRIANYARRTLTLADDFIQLARAEAAAYDTEEVSMGDLLIEAADDLWPLSSARGITVATEIDEADPLVRGDRALLTRALINIIGNAIKYSPDGTRITGRVTATKAEVSCSVADEGRGLTKQEIEALFRPFSRASEAGRVRTDGAGLGLSFVRTVVERHGGTVTCRSRPGEGATFIVKLPRAG
jgi:CHASE2 domain-containing sensor protein/signal transduction histidine kinase